MKEGLAEKMTVEELTELNELYQDPILIKELDTNEMLISIHHTLGKLIKQPNFKNVQNQQKLMYQPWTIHSIFDVFEIGIFVHFPKRISTQMFEFSIFARMRSIQMKS